MCRVYAGAAVGHAVSEFKTKCITPGRQFESCAEVVDLRVLKRAEEQSCGKARGKTQ